MVNGPTRIKRCSNTQINLIFCNRPERITKSYKSDAFVTGISDHNLVASDLAICQKLTKKRFLYKHKNNKKVSYRILKKDMPLLEEQLKLLDWTDSCDNRPIN